MTNLHNVWLYDTYFLITLLCMLLVDYLTGLLIVSGASRNWVTKWPQWEYDNCISE